MLVCGEFELEGRPRGCCTLEGTPTDSRWAEAGWGRDVDGPIRSVVGAAGWLSGAAGGAAAAVAVAGCCGAEKAMRCITDLVSGSDLSSRSNASSKRRAARLNGSEVGKKGAAPKYPAVATSRAAAAIRHPTPLRPEVQVRSLSSEIEADASRAAAEVGVPRGGSGSTREVVVCTTQTMRLPLPFVVKATPRCFAIETTVSPVLSAMVGSAPRSQRARTHCVVLWVHAKCSAVRPSGPASFTRAPAAHRLTTTDGSEFMTQAACRGSTRVTSA